MPNHFDEFAQLADYSLLNSLRADPDATEDGVDHSPRQVFSGHYVPVKPTPIPNPEYVSHSKSFFRELGLSDELVQDESFRKVFSGDLTPLPRLGWATGYALSIYGTEYTQQCPFQTARHTPQPQGQPIRATETQAPKVTELLKQVTQH